MSNKHSPNGLCLENTASSGGAVNFQINSYGTILNSSFVDNVALDGPGGAVHVFLSSSLLMIDATIQGESIYPRTLEE